MEVVMSLPLTITERPFLLVDKDHVDHDVVWSDAQLQFQLVGDETIESKLSILLLPTVLVTWIKMKSGDRLKPRKCGS